MATKSPKVFCPLCSKEMQIFRGSMDDYRYDGPCVSCWCGFTFKPPIERIDVSQHQRECIALIEKKFAGSETPVDVTFQQGNADCLPDEGHHAYIPGNPYCNCKTFWSPSGSSYVVDVVALITERYNDRKAYLDKYMHSVPPPVALAERGYLRGLNWARETLLKAVGHAPQAASKPRSGSKPGT